MTTELDKLKDHLAAIEAMKAETATLVKAAKAAGASAPAIGAVMGVTRQRVYQLLAEPAATSDRTSDLPERF